MANLSESPVYESGIYQLETTDPVLGGANGVANLQGRQLANRTAWLKSKIDNLGFGTTGVPVYTGNLNSLLTSGWWYATTAATNKPSGATEGFVQVVEYVTADYSYQVFHSITADRIWTRRVLDGPTFGSWSEIGRAADLVTLNDQLIGSVATFAMNTPPTGWFKCNGAAISRATYAALFAKIGTTFGAGNGSTTFNLPDLRGEFVRGWDDGRGLDPGRVFGSAQGYATEAHTHFLRMQTLGGINNNGSSPYATTVANSNDSTTTMTQAQVGGEGETRPRNIALLYAIKWQ